jgi:multisubunit Na+/H+ antiporter MnhB subunit
MDIAPDWMLNCQYVGRIRSTSMLGASLVQRTTALISAVLGGYGVFCVIYSFSSPEIAGQALILLGAAIILSHLSSRR